MYAHKLRLLDYFVLNRRPYQIVDIIQLKHRGVQEYHISSVDIFTDVQQQCCLTYGDIVQIPKVTHKNYKLWNIRQNSITDEYICDIMIDGHITRDMICMIDSKLINPMLHDFETKVIEITILESMKMRRIVSYKIIS